MASNIRSCCRCHCQDASQSNSFPRPARFGITAGSVINLMITEPMSGVRQYQYSTVQDKDRGTLSPYSSPIYMVSPYKQALAISHQHLSPVPAFYQHELRFVRAISIDQCGHYHLVHYPADCNPGSVRPSGLCSVRRLNRPECWAGTFTSRFRVNITCFPHLATTPPFVPVDVPSFREFSIDFNITLMHPNVIFKPRKTGAVHVYLEIRLHPLTNQPIAAKKRKGRVLYSNQHEPCCNYRYRACHRVHSHLSYVVSPASACKATSYSGAITSYTVITAVPIHFS